MNRSTRMMRNISFGVFLSVAAFAPQSGLIASGNCGEYACNSICQTSGGSGYTYFFGCEGDCDPGGNCGLSMNCASSCLWCPDGGGWTCF